jgi:hypothetical protein
MKHQMGGRVPDGLIILQASCQLQQEHQDNQPYLKEKVVSHAKIGDTQLTLPLGQLYF